MYNQLAKENEFANQYPWSDWMLFVLYVFSIFLAITSNSIILIIFYRKKKTKSATYVLMSNMAISDLLSSTFIILQWYFCSTIFFPTKPTDLLYDGNQLLGAHNSRTVAGQLTNKSAMFLNNFTNNLPVDFTSRLPKDLPVVELARNVNAIDNHFHTNTSGSLQHSALANQPNDPMIDQHLTNVSKSDFVTNRSDQSMLASESKLSNQHIQTIREDQANSSESIIELSNRHVASLPSLIAIPPKRTTNPISGEQDKRLHDQNSLQVFNQQSQDELLVSVENEAKFRRKRAFDTLKLIQSTTDTSAQFAQLFNQQANESNDLKDDDSKLDTSPPAKKSTKLNENLQSFVNQVTDSDQLIKSNFISQMPNCGQKVCAVLETLQMSSYYVSALTMAGIAYNRYNLINRPLSPKMDTTLLIMVLTIIWFTSITIALLASLSSLRVFVFFTQRRFIDCRIILSSSDAWNLRKWRALILMVIQYILPLSAILFLYVKVIKELRRCGLVRAEHQSSASSNTMSIDRYMLNRRFTNPEFDYGSIKRTSTFGDQSDVFKICLDKRPETNNNVEKFIETDLRLHASNRLFHQTKSDQPSRLPGYFERINLVNLPLVKQSKNKSTNDRAAQQPNFVKYRSSSLKERLSNQLARVMNKKLVNGKLIKNQSQSSSESHTASIISQKKSQSVPARLNILDDELDRTKRRLTKMMIIVVLLFAIAWLPVSLDSN